MTDTSPEIAEMVRARMMARTGPERFLMGVQMFEAAQATPVRTVLWGADALFPNRGGCDAAKLGSALTD